MSKTLQVTARVQLTVEVVCSQPWFEDVQLPQVWKQAAEDAIRAIGAAKHHFTIVGTPKVTIVLVEKDE